MGAQPAISSAELWEGVWERSGRQERIRSRRAELCPQSSGYRTTYLLFLPPIWSKLESLNQGRPRISSTYHHHYVEGILDWKPAEIFLGAGLGVREL